MSQHHTEEPHDIQALQKHLTEAQILTAPHAPIHDMLHQSHLIVRQVPSEQYRDATTAPNAHQLLERERAAKSAHLVAEIEKDFAKKLIEYKQRQTGREYRLFGGTMVSLAQLSTYVKPDQCMLLRAGD